MATDHTENLRAAAAGYRDAKQAADEIVRPARDQLADTCRAAYRDGMKKADILRAIDHTWSRQWLDTTVAQDANEPAAE